MTLIYRKAAPGHHCRTAEEELFVATNGDSNRILHHQRATSSKINVPLVRMTILQSLIHLQF